MKDIKIVLRELIEYYDTHRAVGNTHLMRKGVDNVPCFVVHTTQIEGESMGYEPGMVEVIDINNIDKLLGKNKPIAFDNAALSSILYRSLVRIKYLEEELNEVRMKSNLEDVR